MLRLSDLLQAAGKPKGLDSPMSDEFLEQVGTDREPTQVGGVFDTIRFWGVQLVVDIVYTNKWQDHKQLRYQYVPRVVHGLNHLDTEIKYSDDGLTRFKYKRYGVNVSFKFKGVLEKYSFIVMMQTLIAGLALLVVARTIMVLLALYVFSDRQIYKAHIVHTTEDMEVYRKRQGLGPEARAAVRSYAQQANRTGDGILFDWYMQRDRYERIAEAHDQALGVDSKYSGSQIRARDDDEASNASLVDSDVATITRRGSPPQESQVPTEWVNPAFAEPTPTTAPESSTAQPPQHVVDEDYLARKKRANPYNQTTLKLDDPAPETYSI